MNVESLRNEVRLLMKNQAFTQEDLSVLTGIPQANISRFLSGTEMRSSHTLALLTLVNDQYSAQRINLTATPTTPPGGEGGVGEPETAQEGRDA